ncbi:MAG: hypothetical protein A2X35_00255 [Elusimicrobia bacterium GWA2_61_42]|nr:MAG: hypothetical protein A2X35_00255 [Elusimicrobia bacterium GWA2_61_42]OGR74527.1 MAG: hypothetical protein A2X38_08005 [Elusimicrobia bacterium GWC2_61_25]
MKNKALVSALAALLSLPFIAASSSAQASGEVKEQIAKVQKAITAKGARWVAGETAVSGLSREDWQYLVGFDFQPIDADPVPMTELADLPAALDWRSANGNFVTAPRNQKKCGSCWAFAMTGGLESYILRQQNTPGADLDLSEQVMLSCSGAGSCNGGRLTAAFLKKTGLPPEAAYPYTALDGSCASAAAGWQTSAYKVGNWGSVSKNVTALKTALANYGPLPTAFMVYEDFMHYKSGVYSYTTGKKLGGHAVLLVGYNDAEKYFIVKNSWDTGWGEEGFFKIAYSEMNNAVSFGMSTIAYYAAKTDAPGPSGEGAAWQRVAPLFENLTWN